jgi:hypothetical protein
MKVIEFKVGKYKYIVSAKTRAEALEYVLDGYIDEESDITEETEIPESEWDIKDISVYEDNDFETEAYKVSINDSMFNQTPMLISTNDFSTF